MRLSALLVTTDSELAGVLRCVLGELDVQLETAASTDAASIVITQRRFDAVIIDCDDVNGGSAFLRTVRRAPSTRMTIIFAVNDGRTSVAEAFDLGANFVLEKPVTAERAARSLRAAHGLMVRERRRYLRQPVNSPAQIVTPEGVESPGTVLNVSEGGLAVRLSRPVTQGASIRIQFTLPGAKRILEGRAEVLWTGPEGRAGLRIIVMPEESRAEMNRWLAEQFAADDAPLMSTGAPVGK